MLFVPSDIRPLLEEGGWFPGRAVAVGAEDRLLAIHPARSILTEFSGLTVGRNGKGVECAASDARFQLLESDADDEEIDAWSSLLPAPLVGIGMADRGDIELFVDAAGRLFGRSLIHDAFCLEGESFPDGLRNILLGYRARPMLLPNQDSIELYGIKYTRLSSEVFWQFRPLPDTES